MNGKYPFILTQPLPTKMERMDKGWRLIFPAGAKEVAAWVFSGAVGPQDVAQARQLSVVSALRQATERWATYSIPFGRITVADPAIQALIDASIRTIYQAREVINGRTQFNSSFTLYRGLWAGDAVYLTTLAAHLGDSPAARQTFDALFAHQLPNGIIDELHPQ